MSVHLSLKDDYYWQYVSYDEDFNAFHFVAREGFPDPIGDETFNLNEPLFDILESTLLAQSGRLGNCRAQSDVAFNFLWERAGDLIHRIERIGMNGFDHALLIINRAADSVLDEPGTWGDDCICLDPWFKSEGRYFSGKDFYGEMPKTQEDVLEQCVLKPDEQNLDFSFHVSAEVCPASMPYPKYDKFHDLAYYYDTDQHFIAYEDDGVDPVSSYEAERQEHAKDFKPVLKSVLLHSFFKPEESIGIGDSPKDPLSSCVPSV